MNIFKKLFGGQKTTEEVKQENINLQDVGTLPIRCRVAHARVV